MIKYRIVECVYDNGKKEYKVQKNLLFGIPFLWFTVSYSSLTPPHPDLTVPAFCELNAVYNNLEDAKKCLNGLKKNPSKIVKINKI